jgi:hypothetical protein
MNTKENMNIRSTRPAIRITADAFRLLAHQALTEKASGKSASLTSVASEVIIDALKKDEPSPEADPQNRSTDEPASKG